MPKVVKKPAPVPTPVKTPEAAPMLAPDPAKGRTPVYEMFDSVVRIRIALEQLDKVGVHPSDATLAKVKVLREQAKLLLAEYETAYKETLKR